MKEFKTITPEQLLPLVQAVFKRKVDWERCLILYDKIHWFSTFKKNQDEQGAEICISYLRSILGGKDKAKIIINKMKEIGVIKCKSKLKINSNGQRYESETYRPGETAKKYLIRDEFLLTPQNKRVRYVTERLNLKALNRAFDKKTFTSKLYLPNFEHVWVNLGNVGIDIDRAVEFIKSNFKEIKPWRYSQYILSLAKIDEQCIDVLRGSNGRLITTLTNLKKEFRQFLYDRVDDKYDFNEVDISNSQPLFVSIYLEKHYPVVLAESDFLKWKELCQTGKIYEFLATELKYDREFIKDRFMDVILFTAKNKTYLLQNKKWNNENQCKRNFITKFIELFPTIWDILLRIKNDIGNREFAKRIQRMESELMIDTVLLELNEIGTHFSIHDSIVCRTYDIEYISEQIRQAFKINHGYHVSLKIKQLY